MILVDTSVWIDHLRHRNPMLADLLDAGMVLAHPFVIGEIALGTLRQRDQVLSALGDLPAASVATDAEALGFIERERLFGMGIGYIDAHLLAAVRLTPDTFLWTEDKSLASVAGRMGLAMAGPR